MAIAAPLKYSGCDTVEEVQQLQRAHYLNEVSALANIPARKRSILGWFMLQMMFATGPPVMLLKLRCMQT